MALNEQYLLVSSRVSKVSNELRMLGLSDEIQLPTLVIAGNQSSGKSSVVEAIAGIPLPRSAGTCTRCPTEVRLKKTPPPWSCRVLLKKEFDSKGLLLPVAPPEEEVFSEPITNRAGVGRAVMKAQAILLNPTAFKSLAVAGPQNLSEADWETLESQTPELDFTSNSIVLEIDGATVDLTVIDLPGIIQSHPKGQTYVEMIKGMVVMMINRPNVIIAKTITAMDDPENQAVNQEAKTADPDGSRTIGIITKPDNVPKGEHGKWLELASNKNSAHQLSLGWYVVKNPNQREVESGILEVDARTAETKFFASDIHWSKMDPQRLGAVSLRNALSEILIKRIIDALPAMKQAASDELKKVSSNLEAMPKPLGDNLEFELQTLLSKLVNELDDEAQGKGVLSDLLFYQQTTALYNDFEKRLIRYLPSFEVNKTVVKVIDDEDMSIPPVSIEAVRELRLKQQGRELPGERVAE